MSEYLTAGNLLVAAAVYATVCGVAGLYVAAQTGRSMMEGLLLSVIFGPLGLVVAAALPRPAVDGGTVAAEDDGELEYDRAVRANLARMEPARPAGPPPVPSRRRLLGEAGE